MHQNGDRFFWNGDTEWFFLSESFSDAQRNNAIAFLAGHHVNNLLMTMINDDTYDVFPWPTSSDKDHFDLGKMRIQTPVFGIMEIILLKNLLMSSE